VSAIAKYVDGAVSQSVFSFDSPLTKMGIVEITGELGYHVLDTMVAIDEAITNGHTVPVESRVQPVPLVAEDYDPFQSTL
jgi:hypothetical protein